MGFKFPYSCTCSTPVKWHLHLVGCSSTYRKPSESMRLIVTTFVGVIFGFFIGISFPTLSITKVQTESFFFLYSAVLPDWVFYDNLKFKIINNGMLTE